MALRASLNEVNRLESRRRKKIETLRTKAKEDDVSPELLKEAARLEREYPMQAVAASQFESLFDRRLQRYAPDEAEAKREESEQERLLSRVAELNTGFQNAKRGDTSSKEREQALQNLENAYLAYKEILRNLETGRKFWNDLSAITTRFRDECRNFVYTRRTEAQTLESEVSTAMAGIAVAGEESAEFDSAEAGAGAKSSAAAAISTASSRGLASRSNSRGLPSNSRLPHQ